MRTLFCLVAFSTLLSAQESASESRKPAAITTAEKNKLSESLPAPPGFVCDPKIPARFYGADLPSYLAAKADAYFDYGLVALAHREFKCGDVDLTSDIYDMGDSLRAFGIYSAERSPDDMFIPMGAQGYVDIGVLNFLQGDYYVKLKATGNMERAPSALEWAAKSIVSRIGVDSKLPQPVKWLPAEGQVEESIQYIVRAPMGFDFLAPAVTAIYSFGEKRTTILAFRAATPEEAMNRLGKLNEKMASRGPMTNVAGAPGARQQGRFAYFAEGCWIVVVEDPPANADAFLTNLRSHVKD